MDRVLDQFDVCRNRGRRRGGFPYFVVVQSNEFRDFNQRLVVPLVTEVDRHSAFNPSFTIEGISLIANTLLIFSIEQQNLGDVVGSIANEDGAAQIITAIDRVISRAYR